MALVRLLKVYQSLDPSPSLLVEHKNLKEYLWLEKRSAVILNSSDGNFIKQNSTKLSDAYGCIGALQMNNVKGVGGEQAPDQETKIIIEMQIYTEGHSYCLVLITGCKNIGRILDSDIYRVTDVSFISMKTALIETGGGASEMKRLLCNGSFYFMSSAAGENRSSFITQSLQSSVSEEREEFLWNRNLISYFLVRGVQCRTWMTYMMCGGVDIRTFYVGSQQGRVAVINRLSCERAGTRYNVRGVDDDGNVANFVESEQIICIGDIFSSFIMTRGSVPLFWEQPGLNVGSHKVKIPFCFDISFPTYERHFEKLKQTYTQCGLVNLLGSKEGEATLSRCFIQHHESSKFSTEIPFFNFDYHSECRTGRAGNITKLMNQINPFLDQCGIMHNHKNQASQHGVIRVNCLDCLDRTNSVQTYVGIQMAAKQLAALGHLNNAQLLARVTEPLKAIWQHTGDLISRMYAGTGALEGKDAVGKLKDGAKSLSRSIQNNFLDQGKQDTMDSLLRVPQQSLDLGYLTRTLLTQTQLRSSSLVLLQNLYKRKMQFCDDIPLRVCVGTWNVNGGKLFRSIAYKNQTLKDWLIVDDEPSTPKSCFQALYEYDSNEEGDLNLALNDIVTVDYHLEDGEWLHGFKGHEEGIFPAGYVQELKNPHLVLHDFPLQQEGDLELFANEVVDVTDDDGEWWSGVVYRDGVAEDGTFPANFVEKMELNGQAVVDIYAIGFEEMVELNAGNIVNASQANQQAWATELQKTLSPANEYILVTSEQLVGVCLFVFVRKALIDVIRDVSVSTIKTGMGGTTGNKGAVGISFTLYNSSLCFVCSHFAAGQTQIQERNNDYDEISTKLNFLKNRPLLSHDYIFWCGDFNYRIDLTGDEVKELVRQQAWDKLREHDQLLVQRKMGNVFKDFNEGEINFAPTYKYDLFSDDYDTSEKCRVPAWTDRVLWKRKKWLSEGDENECDVDCGKLISYNRAELKTSDHRPVMAMLDITVSCVRYEERSKVHEQLTSSLQPTYSSLYIYIDGKPCDEMLCMKFIDSLNISTPSLTRCLSGSLLVIFNEAWMVGEVLKHDGTFFEGKKITVSSRNDNKIDDVSPPPPRIEANDDDISLHSCEDVEVQSFTQSRHFPSSHSSGNLSLHTDHSIARPSSTSRLSDMPSSHFHSPATTPKAKKPPPRPPAISNPRLRPGGSSPVISPENETQPTTAPLNGHPFPSSSFNSVSGFGEPKSRISREESVGLTMKPTLPPADKGFTKQEVSFPPTSFPDLSNWMIDTEPPKIKPRKTVPKRRAPVPPKAATSSQKNTRPPPPSSKLGVTGSLLDSSFWTSQPMAPLIPFNSSLSSVAPSNDSSLLSSLDPFGPLSQPSLSKPPPQLPNRVSTLMPTKTNQTPAQANDPFGDLVFSSSNSSSQDPWGGTGFGSSQINKSFTTDFSDFNFQSK